MAVNYPGGEWRYCPFRALVEISRTDTAQPRRKSMTRDPLEHDAVDPVEEASRESFPASDPPGWVALRSGVPAQSADFQGMSAAECQAWNRALETAALLVEGTNSFGKKLSADIRARKRAADG
jgi:hypothetical protein